MTRALVDPIRCLWSVGLGLPWQQSRGLLRKVPSNPLTSCLRVGPIFQHCFLSGPACPMASPRCWGPWVAWYVPVRELSPSAVPPSEQSVAMIAKQLQDLWQQAGEGFLREVRAGVRGSQGRPERRQWLFEVCVPGEGDISFEPLRLRPGPGEGQACARGGCGRRPSGSGANNKAR